MNENDINVLLDHFVGGLDSSESANVTHKINTLPQWSKTYKQLNLVFRSLNAVKDQNNQQSAPAGLASKTFQKIFEQEKEKRGSSEFIAQKSNSSEQSVFSASRKRVMSVKPSVLVFSACAGFLFIFALTFSNSFLSSSNSNSTPKPTSGFAATNTSSNNSTDFAVTGSSQQPLSLFFCSDSISDAANQIPFPNEVNNFAINSSEQLVDLSGSSVYSAAEHREPVKMACPDGFVVFSSQSKGRPIILVQPRHFPGELKDVQNVVNQPNANFVVPVNYQN